LWNEVFKLAEGMKGNTGNDMIPFWHVEPADDIMIERIVPLYPFSKDVDRFDQLQKILFYYRLTFGQPRQDELIQSMNDNAIEDIREYIDQLVIDLSPINFTKTNPQ